MEREQHQTGTRWTKRQEKNRHAARKSRQKQTERADELHEELQSLEQANSAFQKEITGLKKQLLFYERALERHKPYCCLKPSAAAISPTGLSMSSSGRCKSSSSPPRAPSSPGPPPPPTSTSCTSSLDLQILHPTERTRLSPSACVPVAASSAKLLITSSFSSSSSSSSSFHKLPLITSRQTGVGPDCAPHAPSTAAQLKSDRFHKASLVSETSHCAENAFSIRPDSMLNASSNAQTTLSHLEAEKINVVGQTCLPNAPQLYPSRLSKKQDQCTPPYAPLTPTLLDTASRMHTIPPQAHLDPFPGIPGAFKQSFDPPASSSSGSLLSLLTVPSPYTVAQTTSSSLDEFFFHSPPSQTPPLPQLDFSKDISLSEFLDINDWIFS
ncbi:uncharacterized protein batf2 [Menidia menidia]